MRKMERMHFIQWAMVRALTRAEASAELLLASMMRQVMEHTKTGCRSIHGYIGRKDIGS